MGSSRGRVAGLVDRQAGGQVVGKMVGLGVNLEVVERWVVGSEDSILVEGMGMAGSLKIAGKASLLNQFRIVLTVLLSFAA